MWRIIIRLLSDTNTHITPNSPSRVLRQRHPIFAYNVHHRSDSRPLFRIPEGNSLLPGPQITRRKLNFWTPHRRVYAQQQLHSFSTEFRFCVRKIHFLVSDSRIQTQTSFRSTEQSRLYAQLPSRVFRKDIHLLVQGCGCLCEANFSGASCSTPISRICTQKAGCLLFSGIQASRLDFRVQLHAAALALPLEQSSPPEAALLHLQLSEDSSSQPPITDVHGTLNTVLWGIPMIANQMSSKSTEGHIVDADLMHALKAQEACPDSLQIPQLKEFLRNGFVKFAPPASPARLESAAASNSLPMPEAPALPQCTEEHDTRVPSSETLSKETQSTEKQSTQVIFPQESPRSKHLRLRRRQMKVESEAWQRATEDYKKQLTEMCKNQLAPSLPFMKSLFLSWFEPLTNAIRTEQEAYRRGEYSDVRSSYGPYLELLPADKLAVITMHKTIAKLLTEEGQGGLRVVIPVLSIGEAVEQEVRLQRVLKKKSGKQAKEQQAGADEVAKEQLEKHKALQKQVQKFIKQKKMRMLKKKMKEVESSEPWSKTVTAQVGCRLLELLIETAYIQDPGDHSSDDSVAVRPAFRHSIRTILGKESGSKQSCSKKYGVIECDPFISKGIHKMAQGIVTPYMPMLVKPLPWQGYKRGGHLVLPTCIMRTHGAKELRETLKRTPKRQLTAVFDALDILGATKWRINTRIFKIVEKIWEEGGRIADLVDRDDVPEPQKPQTDDAEVLKKWRWEVLKVKRINRELHSQRCDIELKLSVARQMKNEECFYYPHNIDFRGRAYPMHPHLNHLGSDMCRGLLEFAEGCPLKDTGFRWLKIHLTNLYGNGVDKLSFDGRVAFVDENMEDILDSARRPLEGNRWWLRAEDPFQCLATCMEISDALSSPNVEKFISRLPVHQDGSCNGLQHYAALGRDVLGAESVNLTAQEKPADVYTDIALRVKGLLEKDFSVESLSESAKLLHSEVDRKLVKQTVMTSVYGVTYVGARDQIMNRLQERHAIDDDKKTFSVSCYAAKTTLAALGEMFEAARIIMGWLGDCAKIIASHNQPVKWKTPLGLPVVQPYRRLERITVKTSLQNLAIIDANGTKVLVKRQKTAFPPNFVHSLDSTHMMMTAIACKKLGLTFAGVHDSFWTHAGEVDKMNVVIREKFVELYSQPILENLLKSFEESFPDVRFPPVPARGDFDLREVLRASYFFN
eukprot:c25112_g1_i1 orf=168-3746(+)